MFLVLKIGVKSLLTCTTRRVNTGGVFHGVNSRLLPVSQVSTPLSLSAKNGHLQVLNAVLKPAKDAGVLDKLLLPQTSASLIDEEIAPFDRGHKESLDGFYSMNI